MCRARACSAPLAARTAAADTEDRRMAELAYTEPEPKIIAGARGDWEMVIGMEVHAQVSSNAKLFSGRLDRVRRGAQRNVSLVDAAMPGMLPVINAFCVEQAVRTGLGLKAKINRFSRFDRKNYFYPDLPQGYQISQLYHPIVGEGEVIVDLGPGRGAQGPDRAHPPGAGRGQVDARHGPRPVLRRSQPHRRGADGDRQPAGHPRAGGGGGVSSASSGRSCAISGPATATCRRGACART